MFLESQRLPHHEEVGQHDERGVALPALPAAAPVVAQAKELLAVPEVLLNRPAQIGCHSSRFRAITAGPIP